MLECAGVLRPSAQPLGALYRIKNYIWIKKWLTAIVSLKAAPWAVFPEKMKATYAEAYLADCRQKFNTSPRKCLGFASPASRFFFELNKLHFKVECAYYLNLPYPKTILLFR